MPDDEPDDESAEVSKIAGCILSVKRNGDVHLECSESVESLDISRDEIKTLDGISDVAVEKGND